MRKLTNAEFIERAILIHGNKYDYSLVNYINSRTNVDIICKLHGIFSQNPKHHVDNESNCPECVNEKLLKCFASTTNEFINKANRIHGGKYDYSKVNYVNAFTKVIIGCKEHGDFRQQPNNHLSGAGCPACKESWGEKEISKYLNKHNLMFERQFGFDDLKDKSKLYYDFYLPNHNLLIEFDGIQHYKPITFFGGITNLNETKKRDVLKMNYAINNKINLIKIPYSILGDVEEALECELKNLSVI